MFVGEPCNRECSRILFPVFCNRSSGLCDCLPEAPVNVDNRFCTRREFSPSSLLPPSSPDRPMQAGALDQQGTEAGVFPVNQLRHSMRARQQMREGDNDFDAEAAADVCCSEVMLTRLDAESPVLASRVTAAEFSGKRGDRRIRMKPHISPVILPSSSSLTHLSLLPFSLASRSGV